jgi:hypothetical protein
MVKIQFQIILIQFLKISFPQAVLALKNAYFQVLGTPSDPDKTDKCGLDRANSNLERFFGD